MTEAENDSQEGADIQVSKSTLESYLGLDKREGLVRIGKRLMRGTAHGHARVLDLTCHA